MNITEQIEKIKELQERYDALSAAHSEAYKALEAAQLELCESFRETMTTKMEINGLKVEAKFHPVYTITGGKLKAPETRAEVVDLLVDGGYLEADKVARFEAVEVADNSLQAAFRKLPAETILRLNTDGKISIHNRPKVSIKSA